MQNYVVAKKYWVYYENVTFRHHELIMNIRAYIGLLLLLLVVVFIVQNANVVDIQFLFWKISMSRSLMIFFVLATGIIIGWITAGHFHKKHDLSKKKSME